MARQLALAFSLAPQLFTAMTGLGPFSLSLRRKFGGAWFMLPL
jgi:hypothetical protein